MKIARLLSAGRRSVRGVWMAGGIVGACAVYQGPGAEGGIDEARAGADAGGASFEETSGGTSQGGTVAASGGTSAGNAGSSSGSGGNVPSATGGAGAATGSGGLAAQGGGAGKSGSSSGGSSAGVAGSSGASGSGSGGAETGGSGASGAGGDSATGGSAGCSYGDCCPNDPAKGEPGVCGCGVADADGDGDGTPDCHDSCPKDAQKTAPGSCGCGLPDYDSGATVSCVGLKTALAHRYSFEGTGTTVKDAAGSANGTLMGGATRTVTNGKATLRLDGGTTDQYVNLPNGMLSSLSSVTVEAWLTWSGGNGWQRIFDFGDSTSAEGSQNTGKTYLFLTPMTDSTVGSFMRAGFSLNGNGNGQETFVESTRKVSAGQLLQLAVVADSSAKSLTLYMNGKSEGTTGWTGSLAQIHDVNNWVGRSQFTNDPELGATLHDFRIYKLALNSAQLALSYGSGPDPSFLPE